MRVISTKAKDWQKVCWEFVQTGTAFEVPDVTPEQILFLQELCAAHHYKHRIIGNILQLFPLSFRPTVEVRKSRPDLVFEHHIAMG